jgi:outer membrane protein TolC
VRLNAKNAYFSVLRQIGFVFVAQQSVTDAEEQLVQAKKLYEGQQIALVDVQRFEAQLAAQQAALIAAQNNLELARQQFNFVLARPIETPVELTPVSEFPAVPSETQPLVEFAQDQRAEVLALGDTIDSLALTRRATEQGVNPSLFVGLQHQRTFGDTGQNGINQQTFGTLTLSIPVFDSGLTRARVKEARQFEQQAKINLLETKLAIIHRKMQADGIAIPTEVAEYLAYSVDTNLRDMEGVLNSLIFHSTLLK